MGKGRQEESKVIVVADHVSILAKGNGTVLRQALKSQELIFIKRTELIVGYGVYLYDTECQRIQIWVKVSAAKRGRDLECPGL